MPRLLDRYALFYPMRLAASYFLILLVFLHRREPGALEALHWVLVGVLLFHPHVFYFLARRHDHKRQQIEHRAFLVDSLLLGFVVYVTGFSPLPSLILITVALANAVAVSGLRHLLFSALALAAGLGTPFAIAGAPEPGGGAAAVNIACSVFLFVYFMFFAYSSHNRNLLLLRSQEEIREQKSILEIEKARSDQLIHSLIPDVLAGEFAREGRLEPRRLDAVALLAVAFPDLASRLDEQEVSEVLAYLSRSIRACDAIAVRHGLTPVKTTGSLYVAMAGIPGAGEADGTAGIRAALEIRDFLAEQADSRRAHDLFDLENRIAVHSGSVCCGLVATARVTFDFWGDALEETLRMTDLVGPGQVLVSGATADGAGGDFSLSPAGTLTTRSGGEIPLFTLEEGGP